MALAISSGAMYTAQSLTCHANDQSYGNEDTNSSYQRMPHFAPSSRHSPTKARQFSSFAPAQLQEQITTVTPKICEKGTDDGRVSLLRSIRELGELEARANLRIQRTEKQAQDVDRTLAVLWDECASLETQCFACDEEFACSGRTMSRLAQGEVDLQACQDLQREVQELRHKETAVRNEFALLGRATCGRGDFEAQKAEAQLNAENACVELAVAETLLSEERNREEREAHSRAEQETHRQKQVRGQVGPKLTALKVEMVVVTEAERLCGEVDHHTLSWERFAQTSSSNAMKSLAVQQEAEGRRNAGAVEATSLGAFFMETKEVCNDMRVASATAARHAGFGTLSRVVACVAPLVMTLALWSVEGCFQSL